MIKFISSVILILGALGILIMALGYFSSPVYTGSVRFQVDTQAQFVWEELIRIQNVPQKKSDVASVEIVSTQGQLVAWQEKLKNGGYRLYRMNEYKTNERLVVELLESSYGLTGIWEIDLIPEEEYITTVNITERSLLTNVQKRGIRNLLGRNHDLLVWLKYIRVGMIENLLKTL